MRRVRTTLFPPSCIAFCIVGWFIPALATDAFPLDQNRFTALAADGFKIFEPGASVQVLGPLHLQVTDHGKNWSVDLQNVYSYCQRNVENCRQQLAFNIQQLAVSHQEDQQLQKSNLRIVIRDTAHINALEQRYGEGVNALVEPVCGDLWAVTVEDRPTTILYPKPSELITIGLAGDAALKLAIANTKTAVANRIPHPKPEEKRNLAVLFGDDFVTTFAFPELWAPVAQAFGGTLIVAVPSTEQMFMIGEDKPDAIELIRKTSADEWSRALRPLSRSLYRWTEQGWTELPDPEK